MKTKKRFWEWKNQADEGSERVLELYGTIAETSWFDDDVTPQMFHDELFAGKGPVTVWLNSPGGDCIAASQIYTMLMDYQDDVTIKIDGIAASAASVIAMAGTRVLMAPTALMMIHNPMTMAYGNQADMEKAIEMLDEVKESIMNAYEIKTSLSRAKLSHLMDSETWMNANKAIELGFADDIITRAETKPNTDPEEEDEESTEEKEKKPSDSMLFSRKAVNNALMNKLEKHYVQPKETVTKQAEISAPANKGTPAKEIKERLDFIKKFI